MVWAAEGFPPVLAVFVVDVLDFVVPVVDLALDFVVALADFVLVPDRPCFETAAF